MFFALVALLFASLAAPGGLQIAKTGDWNAAPAVVSASMPAYPTKALLRGVQGNFELFAAVAPSGRATVTFWMPCLGVEEALCAEALNNFKTWRFEQGQPGKLKVTYTFKIRGTPTRGFRGNPKIVMDLPSSVTIIMPPEKGMGPM